MVVGSKPVALEYVVACLYHALVVHVDVGDVDPCAYEMCGDVESLLPDELYVAFEEQHRLQVGVHSPCVVVVQSECVEEVVRRRVGGLCEYAYLRVVERSLLHYAECAVLQQLCEAFRAAEVGVLVLYVAHEHLGIFEASPLSLFFVEPRQHAVMQFVESCGECPAALRCYYSVRFHSLETCSFRF